MKDKIKMVAISLYRGNLHRVSDVPRRWPKPTPKLTIKDFKSLLTRRSKALSRLPSAAAVSNPRSLPDKSIEVKLELESPPEKEAVPDGEAGTSGEAKEDDLAEKADELVHPNSEVKEVVLDEKQKRKIKVEEKLQVLNQKKHNLVQVLKQILNAEEELKRRSTQGVVAHPTVSLQVDVTNDSGSMNRQVTPRLCSDVNVNGDVEGVEGDELSNHNFHPRYLHLQILNAEEELKRRSTQGVVAHPTVSLQVDVTNDSGSMNRQVTPRLCSDVNVNGDVEGVEGDELSNHNFHPRYLHRMNSTSPSSESPLRRPPYGQHNVVPHPSRVASLGATGTSPSHFAPSGHQGTPPNLPTVSASGTNFIASSPSPAASGGTSTFRDARLPSPWS